MRENKFYAVSLALSDSRNLEISGETAAERVTEKVREKDTEKEDMLNNIIKKSKMRLFCRLKFCEIGAFLYNFIEEAKK